MKYRNCVSLFFAFTALSIQCAFAQHGQSQQHATPSQTQTVNSLGDYKASIYGAFRNMMQKQDYSAKVKLSEPKKNGANYAVGALSDLRGEITMIDGKYIVSYGGGCTNCPMPHAESATLLAAANVSGWHEPIVVEQNLTGAALDNFIIANMKKLGIDDTQPLPVRIEGQLLDVKMHVIQAPNAGFTGHGSKVHMAKQDDYSHAEIAGIVVGFFAPEKYQGVISHPSEPFHYHWLDIDKVKTAHLDNFGIKKGSKLFLPKTKDGIS